VLQALSTPSFWILGEKDRSIPLVRTVSALDELARTRGRPISVHLIPGVNHGLMDPATGRQSDIWRPMEEWLRSKNILR
jgi:hypothetical protein